jgi:Domain of unknown function (DUF4350)
MPGKLNATDRRLVLIAAVIFIGLVGVTVLLAKPENDSEIPTTYSSGSSGAKAAYLLLGRAGYNIQRWEQSPRELPNGAGTVLVMAEPMGAPTEEEQKKLHEFLESGGRLIFTGRFPAVFERHADTVPDFSPAASWQKFTAQSPSPITKAASQITLTPNALWATKQFAIPLYGDGDKIVAVKYALGKGEVLWWASATPLTNAGLKEPGNLEFFLACIGPAEGRILWDEYFHGYRRSLTASVAKSPAKWIFVQLGIFALAILLTYSRRSGPICAPMPESRLSPLEFVQTLGSLYQQAGAASVAVDVVYQRFRYWLTRRLGMANNATIEELEHAVNRRWNWRDDGFNQTLHACEIARYDNTLRPAAALQLVKSVYKYTAQLRLFAISRKESD